MDQLESKFRILNYDDHPVNNTYKVFHFGEKKKNVADEFEKLLNQNNIWYEKASETTQKKGVILLFGIKKVDFDEVLKYNFLAHGKFRKPLIQNKLIGWIIIFFVLFALILAIISYQNNPHIR